MYAKPICPTPLKILLIVVIAVELVAIGLLLAGRAGASEGGAAAGSSADSAAAAAPIANDAASQDADGNAVASDPATAPEPVTLTVTFAGDCTLGTDINYENERVLQQPLAGRGGRRHLLLAQRRRLVRLR